MKKENIGLFLAGTGVIIILGGATVALFNVPLMFSAQTDKEREKVDKRFKTTLKVIVGGVGLTIAGAVMSKEFRDLLKNQ